MTRRLGDMRRKALEAFMDRHGLKVRPWAEQAGVSHNTIYNFLRGETESLNARTVELLARAARVSPETIFQTLPELTEAEDKATIRRLRVIGCVQAGHWGDAWMLDPSEQQIIGIPTNREISSDAFAIRVIGPSMNQYYRDGSYLICEPLGNTALKAGDHVVVQRTRPDGNVEATCKELVIDSEGRGWLWPRSTHPAHQTPIAVSWPYDPEMAYAPDIDQTQIVAVVVGSFIWRDR